MNTEKKTHNGWSNYQTWLVNLWISNDEGKYRFWNARISTIIEQERSGNPSSTEFRQGASIRLAEELKESVHAECGVPNATLASDLMNSALAEVDWLEIAEDLLSDSEGRPPDTDPVFGDLIHSYSRAEALADGVLVDATETAKEAGFRYPVALTSTVWSTCVSVPEGVSCQDETGRLWDILTMLRHASRSLSGKSDSVLFEVLVRNDAKSPKAVRLKAVCGPNDDASPCVTIMFPEED